MSRISLATDVKTRAGNPDKDARMKNSYIELRGEQSAARKRPSAQGGIAVGTGTPQGGIGFSIGSIQYFIGFWGDVLFTKTLSSLGGSSSSTWNAGVTYNIGDAYTDIISNGPDPFKNPPIINTYYAYAINTNKPISSYPSLWGTTPPPATRWTANGSELIGGYPADTVPRVGYGSTASNAVDACFATYVYTTCPGGNTYYYTWDEGPVVMVGNNGYLHAWAAPGGVCASKVDGGYVLRITTTQTA